MQNVNEYLCHVLQMNLYYKLNYLVKVNKNYFKKYFWIILIFYLKKYNPNIYLVEIKPIVFLVFIQVEWVDFHRHFEKVGSKNIM